MMWPEREKRGGRARQWAASLNSIRGVRGFRGKQSGLLVGGRPPPSGFIEFPSILQTTFAIAVADQIGILSYLMLSHSLISFYAISASKGFTPLDSASTRTLYQVTRLTGPFPALPLTVSCLLLPAGRCKAAVDHYHHKCCYCRDQDSRKRHTGQDPC